MQIMHFGLILYLVLFSSTDCGKLLPGELVNLCIVCHYPSGIPFGAAA